MEAHRVVRSGRGPKRSRRDPQQSRSRKTLERIINAAEVLLDGRDFANFSKHELCVAADVTWNSFSARFEAKKALLFKLHERHHKAPAILSFARPPRRKHAPSSVCRPNESVEL